MLIVQFVSSQVPGVQPPTVPFLVTSLPISLLLEILELPLFLPSGSLPPRGAKFRLIALKFFDHSDN